MRLERANSPADFFFKEEKSRQFCAESARQPRIAKKNHNETTSVHSCNSSVFYPPFLSFPCLYCPCVRGYIIIIPLLHQHLCVCAVKRDSPRVCTLSQVGGGDLFRRSKRTFLHIANGVGYPTPYYYPYIHWVVVLNRDKSHRKVFSLLVSVGFAYLDCIFHSLRCRHRIGFGHFGRYCVKRRTLARA